MTQIFVISVHHPLPKTSSLDFFMDGRDAGRVTDAWNTPSRRELRETVRRFVTRDVLPDQDEWERTGELPRSLHRRAAELGLIGVAFPESAGGGGGDPIDALVVC